MGYLTIGLGVALVLLLTWKKWKVILPVKWQGTVTTAISTASGYATDAVLVGAEQTQVLSGWVQGDLEYIQMVYTLRKRRESWNSPPAVVVPPVDPAVAALQAQVAALTRVVSSQVTSTPPAATAAPTTNVTV